MPVTTIIDTEFTRLDWRSALATLPAWRRDVALRYIHDVDRRQSVAAWLLLQRACREVLGLDAVPAVEHGTYGKPRFATLPHTHFNLSHCAVAVACAVGDEPVGVDVEAVRPLDAILAEAVLSTGEMQHVMQAEQPDVEFIRLWTMKESVLKLRGTGLDGDLRRLLENADTYHFDITTDPNNRWVCTTCNFKNHI